MEDPARVHHDQLSESLGEGGDKDTTWDFVRDMVVLDLADFASAERKGATRFYHKHLRLGNLAGRIQEAAGIAEPPLRGHPGGVPSGRTSKAEPRRCSRPDAGKKGPQRTRWLLASLRISDTPSGVAPMTTLPHYEHSERPGA